MVVLSQKPKPFENNGKWVWWLYSVYKKKATFEIQISHNYSDLIVLKCVELMIRDKSVSYLQKRSIGHVP